MRKRTRVVCESCPSKSPALVVLHPQFAGRLGSLYYPVRANVAAMTGASILKLRAWYVFMQRSMRRAERTQIVDHEFDDSSLRPPKSYAATLAAVENPFHM